MVSWFLVDHRHYIFHGQSLSRWKLVCAVIKVNRRLLVVAAQRQMKTKDPDLSKLNEDFLLFGRSVSLHGSCLLDSFSKETIFW